MYKIIKIDNPEILKQKRNSLWNLVSMDIENEGGSILHIYKPISEYKMDVFKIKLIKKGYREKDLNELLDLHRDLVNEENYKDNENL
jgi:hypothetical protein